MTVEARLEEKRARVKAKLAARAKAKAAARAQAAEEARLERHAKAAARAEAKAAADAQAKLESQERARARAEAKARERAAQTQAPVTDLNGKQRLIDAALRLHAEKRSFASLGIREIAREAHLNPNTFYRHFESLDDLAVAAVMQSGDRLRPMLRQLQRLASRVDPVTVAALEVSAFFAFVLANPDSFVVGVTEYHGGPPRVRETIAGLLNEIATEMRDDIADLGIFPTISRDNLEMACNHIVVHLFHLAQEYIEKPERREYITEASEKLIIWIFTGAALGIPANIASFNQLLNPPKG